MPNVVTLDRYPSPILTLKEVAEIYRLSPWTIRRGLSKGTFRPRPFEKYPYRWRRVDVEADLNRTRDDMPRRKHGFAAVPRTRLRAAKMALDSPPARASK